MDKQTSDKLLWQYAGLATQLIVSMGLALYLGLWIDRKFKLVAAIFIWILPLIVLCVTLIKLIRDTSTKK